MTPLPDDEVHLWYLLTEQVTDPALLTAYEALLTPEERARRDRYRFEHSRREYLLTRALVRTTLSRYAPVAPAAWRFSANEYGRPEIEAEAHRALRFNLSNTQGLIACVVTRGREVGVDVEDTERSGETVSIADSFFSPSEVAALRALPPELRRSRFFDYWTLKEAYIKARGMGLSIPLDQFSFLLRPQAPIGIAFDPRLGDDAATWQFERFALSPRHRTAVAVRRGSGPDLRFVVRATLPLQP
jgi:4'-phosphopantetheinyl transferase